MQSKKPKPVSEVHILTEKTNMKFMPTNFAQVQDLAETSSTSIISSPKSSTIKQKLSFLSSFWKKRD